MATGENTEKRQCNSPKCVLWNEHCQVCEEGYPDGRKTGDEAVSSCRYHRSGEEFIEAVQKEISAEISGTIIPKWLFDRINARFSRVLPENQSKGREYGDEYYDGYHEALRWVQKQTRFPCGNCAETDCSHHGTEYNCAGNCLPE